MTPAWKRLWPLAALGAGWLAPGCSDEPLNPVAVGSVAPPAPEDDGGFHASPPPVDAGPFKRSVSLRNPLGGPVGNLLVDGDYELSTLAEGQQAQIGWRAFDSTGSAEVNIKTETGGLCHSGLRCGVLEPETVLLIRGAAANGGAGNVASISVKPPAGEGCGVATAVVIACDSFDTFKLLQAAKEPDQDGWCPYQAHVVAQDSSICIYVQSKVPSGMTALVDSAVLLPDDGTSQKSKVGGADWAPPADLVESLGAVQDRIRKTTRFAARPVEVESDRNKAQRRRP